MTSNMGPDTCNVYVAVIIGVVVVGVIFLFTVVGRII